MSLERYNVNENKFPGVRGESYDDYIEYMLGNSEKEYILTKDGLYIFYIPEIYSFSIVAYSN